jgi:predicted DNA-binding antitoxin AbrB/MazE fold protein
MTQTIDATYSNGVFTPSQPVSLPEHAQVRITVESLESDKSVAEKLAAWDDLMRIIKPHAGPHLTRDELHERR